MDIKKLRRTKLGVGRYANRPLATVPVDYLRWTAEHSGDVAAKWLATEYLKLSSKIAKRRRQKRRAAGGD